MGFISIEEPLDSKSGFDTICTMEANAAARRIKLYPRVFFFILFKINLNCFHLWKSHCHLIV